MERLEKLGVIIFALSLLMSGCAAKPSKARPVIGPAVPAPYGWDNPINGWCKRNPDDPNCPVKWYKSQVITPGFHSLHRHFFQPFQYMSQNEWDKIKNNISEYFI